MNRTFLATLFALFASPVLAHSGHGAGLHTHGEIIVTALLVLYGAFLALRLYFGLRR